MRCNCNIKWCGFFKNKRNHVFFKNKRSPPPHFYTEETIMPNFLNFCHSPSIFCEPCFVENGFSFEKSWLVSIFWKHVFSTKKKCSSLLDIDFDRSFFPVRLVPMSYRIPQVDHDRGDRISIREARESVRHQTLGDVFFWWLQNMVIDVHAILACPCSIWNRGQAAWVYSPSQLYHEKVALLFYESKTSRCY